ncbi:MAG: 2-oxoglutarate oxidoreductase [Thermoflexales bacterium]|nr:2-oxoglutarate oxidoreductase [Thermoflexales bacterium]
MEERAVEQVVYRRPPTLTDAVTHYCPGCTHGIIHRLIAEVLDELGVSGNTIGIAPVGCAVLAYYYFNLDFAEAAHGRAPAMATGIKRALPDRLVFTYQGDGDLAAIGTNEIIHAATRGELITTIFVNNAIYGMTGGQMAPTTPAGMVTTSSPLGRDVKRAGYPLRVSEMLAHAPGAVYVVRRSMHDAANIRKAKKAIMTAFMVQQAGLGFSMVEILSTCPTNWSITPVEALEWIEENMLPYYPVGDYKVADEVKALAA